MKREASGEKLLEYTPPAPIRSGILAAGGHEARNNLFAVLFSVIILAAGAYLSTYSAAIIRGVAVLLFVAAVYGLGLWFAWVYRGNPMVTTGLLFAVFLFGGLTVISTIGWYYFSRNAGPVNPSEASEASADALAHLAQLGWTIKPAPDSTTFEVWQKPVPPIEPSAPYFRQFAKPFSLRFQQVNGLTGLHLLADIPGCTNIEISAGEFTDVSELSGFKSLKKLTITQLPLNGPGVVDPSPLSSLVTLQLLNLESTKIKNTAFLTGLKNLRSLYLGKTFITDIAALEGLSLLEILDVRDTRAADLSPLQHIKALRELSIGGEQVPALPELAALPNLEKISLIEQKPFDLSPIAELPHLETLIVWGPFRGSLDLAPLQNMKRLRNLTVMTGAVFGLIPVTNAESISALTELKSLTLGQMNISDIGFISNLKRLAQLNLNQLPITSIEPLRNLKALQKLHMHGLAVTDISPLLDLPALTDLTIGRTPARSDLIEEIRRRGVNVSTY